MKDETSSRAQYVERPMPEGAQQRQWLAIRARREQRGRGVWRWALGGLATAAAALLVSVGVFSQLGQTPGEVAAIELSPGVVLEAGEADLDVSLPDGSQVALAEGARLVAERAEPQEVRFSLRRGSARFDVARDPERTFRVLAADVDVRVIGTRFEVRRDPGVVVVSVERGIVEVRRGEEIRRLQAGQSWSITSEEPTAESEDAHAEELEATSEGAEGPEGEPETGASRPAGPSARGLFEDAREARRAGRDREAADLYAELLRRHPRDGRAGIAALELGRLRMDVLHDPQGALGPLRRASSSAPGESLREDAMARLVEAYEASGQRARCREARGRYLDRFPEGVHASSVVRRCVP